MATSMAALSRRVSRALLSNPKSSRHHQSPSSFAFCTKASDGSDSSSEVEDAEAFLSDTELPNSQYPYTPPPHPSSSSPKTNKSLAYQDPILENGLDPGIYRAILVGKVGQKPVQKTLRSGMTLTMLSVGTGGIRNNRRPLENENPHEFAERSNVQWHRVCIYPHRLGATVLHNALPGSILYIDGNLETKIFTDPITGIVRRLREISVRGNGRIIFLGNTNGAEEQAKADLKGFTYY